LGASEAKEKKPPAWNISLRQGWRDLVW
jgi:hypothetical protein